MKDELALSVSGSASVVVSRWRAYFVYKKFAVSHLFIAVLIYELNSLVCKN